MGIRCMQKRAPRIHTKTYFLDLNSNESIVDKRETHKTDASVLNESMCINRYLSLSNNKLTSIAADTFRDLRKLT